MRKFRKKPIVIEAEQFWPHATPWPHGVRVSRVVTVINDVDHYTHEIDTLEGTMVVTPGDWVITGVKGERYPCKPDIFTATYEPAEET